MVEMVLQQEVQQGGLMVGGWGERGGRRVRSIGEKAEMPIGITLLAAR